MLGAIIDDIVGAPHEITETKTTDHFLFTEFRGYTDDTVCTCTVTDWLLHGRDPARILQH